MAIRSLGLAAIGALAGLVWTPIAISPRPALAEGWDEVAPAAHAPRCAAEEGGFAIEGPPGWTCERKTAAAAPRGDARGDEVVEMALRPAARPGRAGGGADGAAARAAADVTIEVAVVHPAGAARAAGSAAADLAAGSGLAGTAEPSASGAAAGTTPGAAPPAPHPQDLVQRTLVHSAGPDGPADVVPFDAPHPTLETAGGAIELARGEVYAVAVREPGGAGDYLVALLTKTSGPATAEELELFRRTIASLRRAARTPPAAR